MDASFSDIFHQLNFGFMGLLEARKDKLLVLTDLLVAARLRTAR